MQSKTVYPILVWSYFYVEKQLMIYSYKKKKK